MKIKKDPTVDGFFFDEEKNFTVEKEKFHMQGWWEDAITIHDSSTSSSTSSLTSNHIKVIKEECGDHEHLPSS